MTSRIRVRPALAVMALIGCLVGLVSWHGQPADAGTLTTTNACQHSGSSEQYNVAVTTGGTATAASPSRISLSDLRLDVGVPDAFHLRLYALGYYTPGANFVGVTTGLSVAATATHEGQQNVSTTTSIQVTIIDPDGVRASGDESVTAPVISVPLPATTWTPTGSPLRFSQAAATVTTSHLFGVATATLSCRPGSTPDGTTVVPAVAEPFEVIIPPAPPTCSADSTIGGPGATVVVDVARLCHDVNGDLDLSTVRVVSAPVAGTVSLGPAGAVSYTNTNPNVGVDTFDLAVRDSWGLESQPFTITVLVQPLRWMEQAGSEVTLTEVTIDGRARVSSGDLRAITVTNLTSSGTGFTVSAYASDLGAPGVPVRGLDLNGDGIADLSVPSCTDAGPLARSCVPAANLGWLPRASVIASSSPVAPVVNPGLPSATSAPAWLQLLTSGGAPTGLSQPQELCSAVAPAAAGTFRCEADLFLGLPASAGAGLYQGVIVVTVI